LVIFGSSGGAGYGASTYVNDAASWTASPATSWAGLLAAALETADSAWTVYNRSESGESTTDAIARFMTDVAPLRPSHVLLVHNPVNDSMSIATHIANMTTLCGMCEAIGAIPILRGATPYDSFTAANYRTMLSINAQLDALGYHRLDHFTTLEDGTGKYISSSYTTDGLHQNDAGHAALHTATDLGIFLRGARKRPEQITGNGAAWQPTAGTGTGITIAGAANLPGNVKSFSVRARIKGNIGGASGRAFMSAAFGTANPLRVRNASNDYDVAEASQIITSTVEPNAEAVTRDVVLTYNSLTNSAALYIDGTVVGTGTPTQGGIVTEIAIGGRAGSSGDFVPNGYAYGDVGVWNVPLSADAIARMYANNQLPVGGLLAALDFIAGPSATGSQGNVANRMPNGLVPVIGSVAWSAQPAFLPLGGEVTAIAFRATGTAANTLPVGTTAQRPGTPAAGHHRVNSDSDALEFYDGAAWRTVKHAGRETVWIPAAAMTPRTTNGAAAATLETTTNKNMFKTLNFDAATQEFAQFEIAMPKSWNLGTVTFEPRWSHPVTTTNFGVVFGLAAVAISNDDAGDVAFGTAQTSTDTGGTTDDRYTGPESAAITIAGSPAVGDTVQFQINRTVADGADTMAVDARLHGIRLFYTTAAADDA
jgi:lysophospholipase L1-like esterase